LSGSGTFIAAYHLTSRAALVWDGGSVAVKRAAAQFYVYFGPFALDRFRAVESVARKLAQAGIKRVVRLDPDDTGANPTQQPAWAAS
jgi:hypothetical protein